MEIKEKPFPRGGKIPALHKSKNTSSFSLFGKKKSKIKNKTKIGKEIEDVKNRLNLSGKKEFLNIRHVEDLSPAMVQEGMLLLGIVSHVTEKIVSVSLPGTLRGVVNILNVSEYYKNIVQNMSDHSEVLSLKEMFEPGDILPVKILSLSDQSNSLNMTCDPKIINSKLTYDVLEKGLILYGSVKSREEYGFIIDFGIPQAHGFLHLDKVKEGKNLKVGQIVRCAVIDCNKTKGSCILQLSTLIKDFEASYINFDSSFPLLFYLPGFQFKASVKRTLQNGIEITYGNKNSLKGFIHEDHLLNKFPKLSQIVADCQILVTLLYVKPLVNISYFKIMPKNLANYPFNYGDIVRGRVIKTRRSGIIVKVFNGAKKAKCFIPINKLKNANKLLDDPSSIESLYPVDKKLSKIRLGSINYMMRHYIGATDKSSLEEKYFSVRDLKIGEIVSCTISSFNKDSAHLRIGKSVVGVVGYTDMTDVPIKNPLSRFKLEQQVKARVMEVVPEMRFVRLTMKPTLLKEKNILCNYEFNNGQSYTGVVFSVSNNLIKVKFFNYILGIVPKHLTPYPDTFSLEEYFHQGQLVKCFVLGVKNNNILSLSMFQNDPGSCLKVGTKYNAEIANKTEKGLLLDVQVNKGKTCKGYLPKELLTIHRNLSNAFLSIYSTGKTISVYCVLTDDKFGLPVLGISEIFSDFYEGKSQEDLNKLLTVDAVLPFLFKHKNFKTNRMFLMNLIPGKNDHQIRVAKSDFQNQTNYPELKKYNFLYGKVLKVLKGNKVDVSIAVSDVWNKDFHTSLEFLDSYLKSMADLTSFQKTHLNAYSENALLGRLVNGVVEEVRSKHAIVKTEDGDLGLVEGKFTKEQKIKGTIVWIDGPEQMIHISANFNPTFEVSEEGFSIDSNWAKLHGKVVFINQTIAVVQLRGRAKGQLAYLPRKRHLNDLENLECPFSVGDELTVWITVKNSKYLLAMDNRIVAHQKKLIWKNSQRKLKESIVSLKRKLESEKLERNEKRRKQSESEDVEIIGARLKNEEADSFRRAQGNGDAGEDQEDLPEIKQEIDDDMFYSNCDTLPRLEYDDIDVKSEIEEEANRNETLRSKAFNEEKIALSSSSESEDEEIDDSRNLVDSNPFKVGFKWEVLNDKALLSGAILNRDDESSSDDEDEKTKSEKKRQKRLTESEKIEKSKTEEQRLRYIEERLMDPDREPETVDDFDRAVLANPDSSALWLKYMAFHIQGTEIEEAKAVARRALKAISFREEQEKLNIWIALLNLENLYGNEDSLRKTLTEALQYNEPYKIHLHMLNLYGRSNKLQEMEKLSNFMLKKYKDVENMWHEVGSAYFSVGKLESARAVLQRALTIVNKKEYILLVSKFALLENKYGNPERAQTLYESILSSFPKRVDIWSCYVDMLVKSKHIDLARQVLERATSQSLRPRKMKTLFKKFLTFEETHGTPENVEKVREAAVAYVQTVGGLNDN